MVQSDEEISLRYGIIKKQYVKMHYEHCILAKKIIGLRTF